MIAGLVQWAFGSEIPEWTGDKLHRERLGLITIALSAVSPAALRVFSRAFSTAQRQPARSTVL